MSVRRALFAAVTFAVSVAMPAAATSGPGVNTPFAGFVTSSTPPDDRQGVAGWCAYAGMPDASGGITYHVSGGAQAYSTTTNQPTYTELTCTLISATQHATFTLGFGMSTVVLAGTAYFWPVSPVQICIDGFAHFGPVTPVTRVLPPECA
jgi:hypothetical protein